MLVDDRSSHLLHTDEPRISNQSLRRWNIGAGVLHLVQGFLMLGASQGVPQVHTARSLHALSLVGRCLVVCFAKGAGCE